MYKKTKQKQTNDYCLQCLASDIAAEAGSVGDWLVVAVGVAIGREGTEPEGAKHGGGTGQVSPSSSSSSADLVGEEDLVPHGCHQEKGQHVEEQGDLGFGQP